MKEGVICLPQN